MSADQTTDCEAARDAGYEAGRRATWLSVLSTALRELGHDAPEGAALAKERAETVAVLRQLCAEHGDNDWSDDLHLADVVEKHLARHLDAADAR